MAVTRQSKPPKVIDFLIVFKPPKALAAPLCFFEIDAHILNSKGSDSIVTSFILYLLLMMTRRDPNSWPKIALCIRQKFNTTP